MTVGMIYGVLAMLICTLIQGQDFVIPDSPIYWMSLLYLAIPGSIIAFFCYIQLTKNIGPELSGYTTVIAPVVALSVSWFLEGYEGPRRLNRADVRRLYLRTRAYYFYRLI